MDDKPAPLILAEVPYSELANQYLNALLATERHQANNLILDAVEAGTTIKDIYLHVFQPTLYEIGHLWQLNKICVAQEHYCTAAIQLTMSQLYPYIFSSEKNGRTFVATCATADLHEIGIRMVADFFEMENWDTFYLGANTSPELVRDGVIQHRADVLGISATLTEHTDYVGQLIKIVRSSPATANLKILVGGSPFTSDPDLWHRLGADATATDAATAIDTANRLLASH